MRKVDWLSEAPRLVGAGMLLFCLAFWAITFLIDGTGAVEPLFVTTGGALLAIGQGAQALGELRQPAPEPPRVAQGNPKVDGGE